MEKLLIIGGTGSLGNALIDNLNNRYEISIISRDENKQWIMKQKYPTIEFFICDIKDKNRFEEVLFLIRPNKIILASALKHIDICENNISDCINTNIIGINNIVSTIYLNSKKGLVPFLNTLCFISTDKASSPVNVYGMCKSISERIVAEQSIRDTNIKYVSVRYGNVLSSRGSIIPYYKSISEDPTKHYFKVTHPDMTRFFISLEESVQLIEKAINFGESGDTFIPKIPSYRIIDIANTFSSLYNKPIKIVGIRPGEKLHECLINNSESFRTIYNREHNCYIIKPCYNPVQYSIDFENEYTSETSINTDLSNIISYLNI